MYPRRAPCSSILLAIFFCVLLADGARAQGPRRSEAAWWAGAGVVLVGSLLLDERVDDAVLPGGGKRWEDVTDVLNYGGRPQWAVLALGGAWAGGKLAGRAEWSRGAVHVGAALLASGVANGALKYSVGRERPNATDDNGRFEPFNGDNRWQSFPSGHAVVAFSLATSLSEEADRPWVSVLAYGGATLVGWSRVYDDKHWTSDVVGGALVGIVASRATLRLLHRRDPHHAAGAEPVLTLVPGGVAVRLPAP